MMNSESENPKPQEESDVAVLEGDAETDFPKRFAVILWNDDYTSMEFVIEVLVRFFKKTQQEAAKIMMQVHKQGKGIAGVYSFEIAETKAAQVNDYAKSQGHPLKCTIEPV